MSEKLPVNPAEYNIFVFYDGYVESNATSPVVMSLRNDHDMRVEFPDEPTPKDAWEVSFASLRTAFLNVVRSRFGFPEEGKEAELPYCCSQAIQSRVRFCPDCGIPTADRKRACFPTGADDRSGMASDILSDLSSSTCNSYDYDLVEEAQRWGWDIPGYMGSGIVTVIHSNAASLLINYEEMKRTHWVWDNKNQFWGSSVYRLFRSYALPNLIS